MWEENGAFVLNFLLKRGVFVSIETYSCLRYVVQWWGKFVLIQGKADRGLYLWGTDT